MLFRLVAALALMTGGAWFGLDLIERYAIYPFDSTRISPDAAGVPRAQEHDMSVAGETIVTWIAAPKPGKPVIFYLHGNAGNLANRAGRFNRFLDRGYGLIAPAYPGSSGSSGAPSKDHITEILAALWGNEASRFPNAPIVIYGESIGSAATIHLLASAMADSVKGVGPPAAVILEAPFTRMQDVILHSYPQLEPFMDQLNNDWDNLKWASALYQPLLVIHGTKDALIPIDMGRAIHAEAPSPDKTFLAIPGAGHTDLWRSDTLPQLWRFIDQTTP